MNKHKEFEYKYRAENVSLLDFLKIVEKLEPKLKLETSSWDIYYTNKENESIRYRKSETRPELTIKRKMSVDNNEERLEVNLPLGDGDIDETIEAFVGLLGYKKNFKIYKSCFIYFFEEVDLVYYIVYDEGMKELNRFIEIEFLEDKAHGQKTEKIVKTLEKYEKKLSSLKISKEKRLKKSLFEMYKK